ncbi:MAG: hypothetical protein AAF654_13240, partial [Myxococcota bacterium]
MNQNTLFVISVFSASALGGCGGNDCGLGTVESDGDCVAAISCGSSTALVDGECVASCGTGTMLMNGQCTAMPDGLVCGADTVVDPDGEACVVAETACTAPASFDSGTGRCVSPSEVSCGDGTELNGSVCIPACPGEFEVQNPTLDGCLPAYRVQLVHASPDPDLAMV